MDPNATLRELGLLKAGGGTYEEIEELVEALDCWLSKGGFEPDWDEHPLGTLVYRGWTPLPI